MENIKIPVNSILFTIAPSNAGKTYFCENYLIPKLKETGLKVKYISSDFIRRELLGENLHKHDTKMLQVSEQSFNLLKNLIRIYSSFPIKNEFIVVDTTGLNDDFRKELKQIAHEVNYNLIPIVFNYKNRDDYFKNNNDERLDKFFISKSVDRLKKQVLKNIKTEKYERSITITNQNYQDINLEVMDIDFYKSHFINDNKTYYIISDIHGCIDTFKLLLTKCGININNDKIYLKDDESIILIGDYLDKNDKENILKTIDFIYNNKDKFKIVIGNHENFVYKYLKGELKNTDKRLIDEHFISCLYLEKEENKEYKNKFFELFEESKHFYWNDGKFYVSHSPCKTKYIGKIDSNSLKRQRTFSYTKNSDDLSIEQYYDLLKEDFNFIEKDSINNSLPIICGHVALHNLFIYKNRYFIDTGCVYNNYLTAIVFNPLNKNPYFVKEYIKNQVKKDLIDFNEIFVSESNYDLETNDRIRIDFLLKNKVNFISGTISPADKNENILEDINQVFNYYKERNINDLVIQPKYMGSRLNIYLFNDVDKCYSTTRNGYLNRVIDLKNIYQLLINKFDYKLNGKEIELIILDGELLPWKVLGENLIENTYNVVKTMVINENNLLKENNFFELYSNIKEEYENTDFKNDINVLEKKDIIEKYKEAKYRTYSTISEYKNEHLGYEEMDKYIKEYSKQLEIFGSDGEIIYKPFNILKIVFKDGTELIPLDNYDNFKQVSDDEIKLVNLNDEKSIEEAIDFYKKLTDIYNMEGVVIKPKIIEGNINYSPFFKVRNERYLNLIYGFDYKKEFKYNKLISSKRIRNKVNLSIKEHNLTMKMLKEHYSDINNDNKKLKNLFIKFLLEEKNEITLDPRL